MRIRGIKVNPMRGTAIDEIAATSRELLAPSTAIDRAVDILEVLEEVDGKVVNLPMGGTATVKFAVESNLPETHQGHARFERRTQRIVLAISERTHDDAKNHRGYARFTCAHEIGHIKLHLGALVELTTIPHAERALARENPNHAHFEDTEWQADRYGAGFLAPDEGLRLLELNGELTILNLMRIYQLTRLTAQIRLENFRKAEHARRSHHRSRPAWRSQAS